MLQYLHPDQGAIPCTISMIESGVYTVTFYDFELKRDTTLMVKKDRLVGLLPEGSTVHNVKSWAHFYDAIAAGDKTHELRHDDRNYQVGDYLQLRRYDNINGCYTGEQMYVQITYITNRNKPCAFSGSVLQRDYCILSIRKV